MQISVTVRLADRSRSCARSIRRRVRYRIGVSPYVAAKQRVKWNLETPATRARASRSRDSEDRRSTWSRARRKCGSRATGTGRATMRVMGLSPDPRGLGELLVERVDGRDGEAEPHVLAHQCGDAGGIAVDDHLHHLAVFGE